MTQQIKPPKLGRLYTVAAFSALRATLSPNGKLKALPAEPVLAHHPGIGVEQLGEYRDLLGGEAFDGVHRRSLPSVLVHIAAFPVQMALMSHDEFPLRLMGLVHLTNEVHHRQPVLPEGPLQILVRAENLRPHRRGTQVDVVTEIYPEGHELSSASETEILWSSVSTYLSRGTFIAGRPETGDDGAREPFTPPMKTAEWRLGPGAGRQYAAVSGDYNPIHLSGLSAKALGMPGAILHGMYSAARMLEGREPQGAGHRWSITFEAPVKLPGTVAFAAEEVDGHTLRFTGWNPRKGRRHFHGELVLP